ncbi:MAG: tetratricopeptide repeat protein, partial [Parvularculaceae bacterium]|nr:tetratricopeptide repeat protein [Parvularculaceae bacterium]
YLFAGNMLEQSAEQRQRAAEAGFNVGLPKYNFPLALAQMAIYLDPDSADARRLVSGVMNVYGNYDSARRALMPIPPSSPHYEQARIEIAAGLVEQGREDEAAKILKETIRLDPRANEARLTYAGLLARKHDYEGAIGVLTAVIDSLGDEPREDAWRYFISRAASLMEIDNWPAAERDLERAVEIAPEEATTLNYLGYSWAERGENLERAFELIEKAVELEPSSGAIIDSLGWAHYQLGEYDQALGHLEQAAALEPADPTITDHLGDVYWRLGREREARFQWRRALELKPVDRVREQVEDKLENGLPAPEASGD